MDVSISCLCGQAAESVRLKAKSLPVETYLCHCNTCRFTSGTLCKAYLELWRPPSAFGGLKKYTPSEGFNYWFCGTCGSHVFLDMLAHGEQHEWWVAPDLVEHAGDVLNITSHSEVKETKDGGLAAYLTGSEMHSPPSRAENSRLEGRCHCGRVQYFITTPNEDSSKLSAPWPDLLVASSSVHTENKDDVKWWMRNNNTKYLAGTCACRSCRLAQGFPIQCWAFVPKMNIRKSDGRPLDFNFGTLQQYESSSGVFREFCERCGATVFWHCEERPGLIDVSVGLLRSDAGARAEDWLDWHTGRVSFKEEARDQDLVERLETSMQASKLKR